jgi:hypothetical protein
MFFVRDHPVGDSPLYLWEPIPWAMGVAHALKKPAPTGVGSYKKAIPRMLFKMTAFSAAACP